jgi:hypothetical protein
MLARREDGWGVNTPRSPLFERYWEKSGNNQHNAQQVRVATPIDVTVASIADRQHGNITRDQLLTLGLTPNQVQYA